FDWRGLSCSSHAECPAHRAECWRGQCLCTPGFYYSHSNNYCVDGCANLQRTFMEYPTGGIRGNNIVWDTGARSPAACQTSCANRGDCRTAEYEYNRRCTLQ
ncbi:hypothetical protein BaRGS_00031358, partial [Batillaria attramentaria]